MSDYEKYVDRMREYFGEHRAELYPFENELLKEKNEYVKSLYFRMLCTLVRYTSEPSEMQVLYIRRLIAGSSAEKDFQGYMKMAMNLEKKDIDEFITALKKDELKYYFCIDGAIVSSLGKMTDKNYELFAELIEFLGIRRDELTYLVSVSKAILCFGSEQFDKAREMSPNSTRGLSLYHYLESFYAGMITDTPKLRHICSKDKMPVVLSNYRKYNAEQVIIENVSISSTTNIIFNGCSKVLIRNCLFNGDNWSLVFSGVGQVFIENCEINNFSNRFAYFVDTKKLYLSQNRFENCGCVENKPIEAYGGVLYSEMGMESVVIEGNQLSECYIGTKQSDYVATGIFLHSAGSIRHISVRNNQFSRCECRNSRSPYRNAYISGCIGYSREETNNICDGPVSKIFEN